MCKNLLTNNHVNLLWYPSFSNAAPPLLRQSSLSPVLSIYLLLLMLLLLLLP